MNASMPAHREPAEAPATLTDRFVVIREMLGDLDNITVAGQHHVMSKIIHFVEAELDPSVRQMRARNRLAFNELLAGLRYESSRLSPDVANFVNRAAALNALLETIA